jgi:phosphatidylserine/phosphatidylglycerophosphate/cardiolipin synthase-like enzyme
MKKLLLITVFALLASEACAKQPQPIDPSPQQSPDIELIESAFSPDEGSEELVLKVINSSEHSIRLAAYSFTSPPIVKALLSAKMRGIDVRVVVDERGNKGKASIAALNLLVNANIPTRTISVYAIHHDKYIVSDERHVQNGSFNYSQAAAKSNSENVIVIWNNPDLAATFSKHWLSRWEQGTDFKSTY